MTTIILERGFDVKESLDVAVLVLRKEKIDRKKESFEDFIERLRAKYTKALKTERVVIQIVQRRGEKSGEYGKEKT